MIDFFFLLLYILKFVAYPARRDVDVEVFLLDSIIEDSYLSA